MIFILILIIILSFQGKPLSDKAHEIFQKQIDRDESELILTDK